MDMLDVTISAYRYVGSIESSIIKKSSIVYITNLLPLYNSEKKIIAYYITFSTNTYAVVFNNTDNPSVIEFGEGKNDIIEQNLKTNSSPILVYNNPVSIYNLEYTDPRDYDKRIGSVDIYDFYPELKTKNSVLSEDLKNTKKTVLKSGTFHQAKGNGDFGFFYSYDMPSGNYTSDMIMSAGTVDWVTTYDNNDIAHDHCGATTATNIALYFAKRGKTNLKINNKRDTFIAVHSYVGNGPKTTIASDTAAYFLSRGYTLNYCTMLTNKQSIKNATTADRPCGILLMDGINSWHWVLGVGWREYTNNDFYIRINDSWHNQTNRYYKPGNGSVWWSVTSYWVT